MDKIVKKYLNDIFLAHFSHFYNSKPEIKQIDDTNYYYVVGKDTNIISLIPLDFLDEKYIK
jgi:hypothetical protein